MNKTDGLQALEKPLASLPDTLRQLILERIQNLTHYEPVIGIMGKRALLQIVGGDKLIIPFC
ncbi:GTPase family protein [Klebsiella pneumoniae]|uniref:hypothetical protein n=1 Tax=Klebsiella pneumoniae TaxID=573 RepID=UPI000E2D4062|nr:hypothetical protein [Klebsiella pneumoniae]SXJ06115.1 GTPase family protein [Klebsiella pneumoniae]